MNRSNPFKGRHYTPSVILLCVRWYLTYSLSYLDLQEMMAERGLKVDASTLYRWVQAYAPELDRRIRRKTQAGKRLLACGRNVDKGERCVDLPPSSDGCFRAKRFVKNTLRSPHNRYPEALIVDCNPAYPAALSLSKREWHLGEEANLTTGRWLNNRIE